jgi:DNA-binding NtrC family response regulator
MMSAAMAELRSPSPHGEEIWLAHRRGTFGITSNHRGNASAGSSPLADALPDQEKEMSETALAKSQGKVAGTRGAAATLGIPPSTLASKIRQLKIEKGDSRRLLDPYRERVARRISELSAAPRGTCAHQGVRK